jgi:hypothetical protein
MKIIRTSLKIIVEEELTGYATPDHRWIAVTDDYDGAPDSATRNQIGRGPTALLAIADLLEQLEE